MVEQIFPYAADLEHETVLNCVTIIAENQLGTNIFRETS